MLELSQAESKHKVAYKIYDCGFLAYRIYKPTQVYVTYRYSLRLNNPYQSKFVTDWIRYGPRIYRYSPQTTHRYHKVTMDELGI